MKAGTFALMTAVGGTAGRLIPDSGTAGYAEVVRDRDEMIRVVRRQVKDGADIIKIHVTGVIPTRSGEVQVWTLDELRTVCDTAHDLGVRVTAHCRGDQATLDAVVAGVDIVWHASVSGRGGARSDHRAPDPVGPVFTFLANLSEYGSEGRSNIGGAGRLPRRDGEDRMRCCGAPTTPACHCCAGRRADSRSHRVGIGTVARWRCSSNSWA